MSPEELLTICQHIKNWVNSKFTSCSELNKWSEAISGGEETDYKQLTITFSKMKYTNTVYVRIWKRIKDRFPPTSRGFCLKNSN